MRWVLLTILLTVSTCAADEWQSWPITQWGQNNEHVIHWATGYGFTMLTDWHHTVCLVAGIEIAQICEWGIEKRWKDTVQDLIMHGAGVMFAMATKRIIEYRRYDEKALREQIEEWERRARILREMEKRLELEIELRKRLEKKPI